MATHSVWAASFEQLEETISQYKVNIPDKIYVEDSIEIDITNLWETLSQSFWDFELEYQWEIFSQPPQMWPKLEVSFDSFWTKTIQLEIFTNFESEPEDELNTPEVERKLLYRYSQNVFVYEKSVPIIIANNVDENERENFINSAQDQWVLLYSLWDYSEESISGDEILKNLTNYNLSFSQRSDYITLWGEKEFLFSVLSSLQARSLEPNSLNIVLLTSYNTSILKNYISNSISGKIFIDTGFIIDESIRTQVLKTPESIQSLLANISKNSYEYTLLADVNTIESYFFISRFISKLSNNGINVSDIYIILLLPIFLTLVWFSKHFIGISTIWSIIPVFVWILFIKLWIIFTLGLIVFLLIVNISLWKLISKYTLLHTPKVTFITIINFLVFMWLFLIFDETGIININLDNIIYIILFFVVAEKLITVIVSKEFSEYKKGFSGTVIVSLICFWLFHFKTFLIFLAAYPEILLILIPFNFILWWFTWLRITEYFRFRETIRSVEE